MDRLDRVRLSRRTETAVAEVGADAGHVRDVLDRAEQHRGITKVTFYRHFRTKSGISRSLVGGRAYRVRSP